MTINFLNNGIKESSEQFVKIITENILSLTPNKAVKFKTSKAALGVAYNKKSMKFTIMLDGNYIEEVQTAEAATESLLSLYNGL